MLRFIGILRETQDQHLRNAFQRHLSRDTTEVTKAKHNVVTYNKVKSSFEGRMGLFLKVLQRPLTAPVAAKVSPAR